MIRPIVLPDSGARRLPRMRGDDPDESGKDDADQPFAPHARG